MKKILALLMILFISLNIDAVPPSRTTSSSSRSSSSSSRGSYSTSRPSSSPSRGSYSNSRPSSTTTTSRGSHNMTTTRTNTGGTTYKSNNVTYRTNTTHVYTTRTYSHVYNVGYNNYHPMYDNSLLLWYVLVMNNNTHQYERVQAGSQQELDSKMGWADPVDEENNGWTWFWAIFAMFLIVGILVYFVRRMNDDRL